MSGVTPWDVIVSPTDPEMYAVQGCYLVADCLPIEDARLIASAPDLLAALEIIANPDWSWAKPDDMREVARAAIARARGEV